MNTDLLRVTKFKEVKSVDEIRCSVTWLNVSENTFASASMTLSDKLEFQTTVVNALKIVWQDSEFKVIML